MVAPSAIASAAPKEFQVQKNKKTLPKVRAKDDKFEAELLATSTLEALECFKEGILTKLDPTVGDWGCHQRALIIIKLYNSFKSDGKLSEEDRRFLGLSRMLTKAKVTTFNPDRSIAFQTTDRTKISSEKSKNYFEAFIPACQHELAAASLKLMQQQAAELSNAELVRAFLRLKN